MEPIEFSPDKFKELMLYAAQESAGDDYFGAVKLNKILFFADFLAFGLLGDPITGATYQKQKNGPVPTEMMPMSREIETSGEGVFEPRHFFNHTQVRLVPKRNPNPRVFSEEELDLINDVIRTQFGKSASDVSLLSHERSHAWQIAEIGEVIPYSTVFLSARKATTEDIDRGRELAKKYGWLNTAR